jgi:signal transduction histidine kinase/CheY-like chemotaxis protein
MWDPRSVALWIRQGLILALLGLVTAATELYVVERLAQEVDVHRRVAEREKEQRLALERSERERARERDERERAQQALEQSRRIEALARVAGGIAHDFNNALTVILGAADIASMSLDSQTDVQKHLDEIVHAARGAAELTRRMLVLGRQRVSRPEPVPLSTFVDRLRDAIRRLLPDDVAVIVRAPADRLTAYVDGGELDRAVLNLVLNARDAMPRGGTLTIGWRGKVVAGQESELSDGRYIALSVADDGHGMDPETLECIFDPFFTTKADRGGTGLGLATVYAFARDSGGSVTVTSTAEQGTTFTLFLPEYHRDSEPEPDPPPPAAVLRSHPMQGCVLVVEDRADVRATMMTILSQAGFDVREAGDGDGALRILSDRTNIALMCIDGIMPGMSTAAVIERALDLSPSMAVLVCSGYVQEELLRRGIATGRYAFLAKPFTAQELLASVYRALEIDVSGHASG